MALICVSMHWKRLYWSIEAWMHHICSYVFWTPQRLLTVNHAKLLCKLMARGVPGYVIRILIYNIGIVIKRCQSLSQMGDTLSDHFTVSNGVRQGGILSPYLFNVYMDNLSDKLNSWDTGCVNGSTVMNHFMYSDDLVVFSPIQLWPSHTVGGLRGVWHWEWYYIQPFQECHDDYSVPQW